THGDAAVKGSNTYVVTLDDDVSASSVTESLDIEPTHVYTHVIDGFAAELSAEQLHEVRSDAGVAAVSENMRVQVDLPKSSSQSNPPWGLDRLDDPELPLDDSYEPTGSGSGTSAYILDTGIDPEHPDFGGRASVGFDA